MKKLYTVIFLFLLSWSASYAQNNNSILITGSRFTYPLVEKWIEEFKKSNPTASIRILTRGAANADSANLIINAHELTSEEIRPGYSVVNLGRYVLLPVANIKNVPIQPYVEKGIKVKDLKRLFFDKFDPYASEEDIQAKSKKLNALASQINIYTRQQKACAPTTFAKNYGFEQVDIVGKQIAGDDKHLIQAVLKDTNGVTYNNLGFVYDRTTRKVLDHLKVIPIDLNNNGKLDENENFYGNLDVLISKLENDADKDIPVGYVNISFPKQIAAESNTAKFLNWVLENGQKFNHEYGFLNLQPDVLVQQKASLPSTSR